MKKLSVILLSLIFVTFSFACAPSVFRENYLPVTTDAYRAFLENVEAKSPFIVPAKVTYKAQGGILVERQFVKSIFTSDLKIDLDEGRITGNTVLTEERITGKTTVKTEYSNKDGKIEKRSGDSVSYKVGNGIVAFSFIDRPGFAEEFFELLLERLIYVPASEVEVYNSDNTYKIHIKVTPLSASALFFQGMAVESAVGDIYLCYIKAEGGFTAIRGVFNATLAEDIYSSTDIIPSKGLVSHVESDFNFYAL